MLDTYINRDKARELMIVIFPFIDRCHCFNMFNLTCKFKYFCLYFNK